ncbi:MAG TPA: hypothetical protein VFX49_20455 [Chloroflexota bacterium]|nr:hypothetical protein [Chloroflexota bacterium]
MAIPKMLGRRLAAAARSPMVARVGSAVKTATRAGSAFVTKPLKAAGKTAGTRRAAGGSAAKKSTAKKSTAKTSAAKKTSTKSAVKASSRADAPRGKRERIDTTPGKAGGSRYVRRDSEGQFTTDQVSVGRSLAADRRSKAKTRATKGNKDRGD